MKEKFNIPGRTAGHMMIPTTRGAPPVDDVMDRFVAGTEPMTTMTVQIPERLKRALKQAALDRGTTVKSLIIELIEAQLVSTKQ
jgi:hypothetical protein